MTCYVLTQKSTSSLGEKWQLCGTRALYETLGEARMAADETELRTGHRVRIESVDETGAVQVVRGPDYSEATP